MFVLATKRVDNRVMMYASKPVTSAGGCACEDAARVAATACTIAVVASCVLFRFEAGVGAVGVPVNPGELIGAKDPPTPPPAPAPPWGPGNLTTTFAILGIFLASYFRGNGGEAFNNAVHLERGGFDLDVIDVIA